MTQKAQTGGKNGKLDFIKILKKLLYITGHHQESEEITHGIGENIWNDISDMILESRIYKGHLQLIQIRTTWIKNEQSIRIDIFQGRYSNNQWTHKKILDIITHKGNSN